MKRFQLAMASLVLALIVCSPALAADKAKKEKKNKPMATPGVAAAMGTLRGVKLTDEQKEKVKEIGKSYDEKVTALNAKQEAAEPAEKRKARQDAVAKAKADGKKGKELKEAVKAAVGENSEEVKAALKAVQEERQVMMKEMKDALLAVLTEDQRTQLAAAPMKKKKDK